MIDTISLKTSLIDLAVSGRLSVEFQAKDSVSDISEKIPAPSNKRKKLLGQTFEYGKQIDIPDNWRWMSLGEISSYGDTPVKANSINVTDNTWVLDLEDIKPGGELLTKTRANEKQFFGEKTVFKTGQVLYSKLRPYLKKVLVANEDGISTPELISFDIFGGIMPQYVMYCLLGSFTNRAIDKRSYGIKMPRIDAGFMVNLPVPIPPVSEQQYIIEKIEKAFTLIDTVDKLQAEYALNQEVLKSKLIDAAIQGKLTEQLPEDGTAEELCEKIHDEKKKLIINGKIKKEKSLPEVTEDEIPFKIPANWKWVRINDVGSWSAGATPSRGNPNYYTNGTIPWVKTGELNDGIITDAEECITDLALKECSVRLNPIGSVLIAMYGATIGKVAILDIEATTNQACCACIPIEIYNKYLFYFLKNNKRNFLAASHGGAQPNISKDIITKSVMPLPPVTEQKRIVERLEAVLKSLE